MTASALTIVHVHHLIAGLYDVIGVEYVDNVFVDRPGGSLSRSRIQLASESWVPLRRAVDAMTNVTVSTRDCPADAHGGVYISVDVRGDYAGIPVMIYSSAYDPATMDLIRSLPTDRLLDALADSTVPAAGVGGQMSAVGNHVHLLTDKARELIVDHVAPQGADHEWLDVHDASGRHLLVSAEDVEPHRGAS